MAMPVPFLHMIIITFLGLLTMLWHCAKFTDVSPHLTPRVTLGGRVSNAHFTDAELKPRE